MALTETHQAVIDFERSWWLEAGPKERAIREKLGISPSRYYKILGSLIDSGLADDYDPLVTRRLRMSRARKRAARIVGSSAGDAPGR